MLLRYVETKFNEAEDKFDNLSFRTDLNEKETAQMEMLLVRRANLKAAIRSLSA